MTVEDKGWVAVCAFGAVGIARVPSGVGFYFAACGFFVLLLVLVAAIESRKKSAKPDKTVLPKVPTSPAVGPFLPEPSPADAVCAQLEAYRVAGFSETQAQELVQEAMRTQIKQAGGWSA